MRPFRISLVHLFGLLRRVASTHTPSRFVGTHPPTMGAHQLPIIFWKQMTAEVSKMFPQLKTFVITKRRWFFQFTMINVMCLNSFSQAGKPCTTVNLWNAFATTCCLVPSTRSEWLALARVACRSTPTSATSAQNPSVRDNAHLLGHTGNQRQLPCI